MKKATPDLRGESVLITAGPTHEYLDDVRFLSNPSTGRMGTEIARAAKNAGADVTIVCGPTHLKAEPGIRFVPVISAEEMLEAVDERFDECSVFIATAAVSDYRPAKRVNGKIKKSKREMTLDLVRNPDVLRKMGERRTDEQTIVGFSLESKDLLKNARAKMVKKHCDLMVVNTPGHFGDAREHVSILHSEGVVAEIPPSNKRTIAAQLIALVASYHAGEELNVIEDAK